MSGALRSSGRSLTKKSGMPSLTTPEAPGRLTCSERMSSCTFTLWMSAVRTLPKLSSCWKLAS